MVSLRGKLPSPMRLIRNQKGVALLIALFAFTLLSFIAVEVAYDTAVEHVVSSQQVNRIKAYYAAKAGVELSLMRIMLYKQATKALGDMVKSQPTLLDPIWSFPFMWPPVAPSEGISEVDKSLIQGATKESLMDGTFATTIVPEGGRIDINDLGSEVKAYKKAMKAQVLKIFTTEVEHNEAFADKYRGYRFEEVVDNITDYIDEDAEAEAGGDETSPYRDHEDKEYTMPPNRALRTVDELLQVAGMKDDFYKILAPRITVFGTKGINITYVDKDVLMSLDPTFTEEAAQKFLERRNDTKQPPITNEEQFFQAIQPLGVNTRAIQEAKIPLLFGTEYNFRIISTGTASNVRREITAITYDFQNLADRYSAMLKKQEDEAKGKDPNDPNGGGTPNDPNDPNDPNKKPDESNKNATKSAKGRPAVVYWEEN